MLLLSAALPVRAQSGPPRASQAEYRDLISKGLQEYQLGHWSEARVFFADAHAIWPNARTFRGLGMACYEARNYVEAIGFIEQALSNQTQPLTPKLAEEARHILEQARRFVSELRLEVEPRNAVVMLDDKPLPREGRPLLDPGEHQLDISAPGYRSVHRTVVAQGGQPVHLHLELVSLRAEAEGEATRNSEGDRDLADPFGGPVKKKEPVKPPEEVVLMLTGQHPLAAALVAGFGLAGIATGWVMFALRNDVRLTLWQQGLQVSAGNEVYYDPNMLQTFRMRGALALTGIAVGSVALSVAQYLWLPDHPSVPAWAWVMGGVGVALGVGALALGLVQDHCEITDPFAYCQQVVADDWFAPLLAIPALPFITLPIIYALRDRLPSNEINVSVLWGTGRGAGPQLVMSGRF